MKTLIFFLTISCLLLTSCVSQRSDQTVQNGINQTHAEALPLNNNIQTAAVQTLSTLPVNTDNNAQVKPQFLLATWTPTPTKTKLPPFSSSTIASKNESLPINPPAFIIGTWVRVDELTPTVGWIFTDAGEMLVADYQSNESQKFYFSIDKSSKPYKVNVFKDPGRRVQVTTGFIEFIDNQTMKMSTDSSFDLENTNILKKVH
jgi:hypothetical protein